MRQGCQRSGLLRPVTQPPVLPLNELIHVVRAGPNVQFGTCTTQCLLQNLHYIWCPSQLVQDTCPHSAHSCLSTTHMQHAGERTLCGVVPNQ